MRQIEKMAHFTSKMRKGDDIVKFQDFATNLP